MKLFHTILMTVAYLFASLAFGNPANTLEQKNQNIEKSINKAMNTFQVPGVAVAIIKDNKVVMSKGFGQFGGSREIDMANKSY